MAILADPDSAIEIKFWRKYNWKHCVYGDRSRGETSERTSKVNSRKRNGTSKANASGPKYLKFYSLIARHAAELDSGTREFESLHGATQHLEHGGHPMMALGLYARRSAVTKRHSL